MKWMQIIEEKNNNIESINWSKSDNENMIENIGVRHDMNNQNHPKPFDSLRATRFVRNFI